MTPDLAALVERLKVRGKGGMEYFSQYGMNIARETKGDPLCSEAAAAIQRLSTDLEREKAMHKVLGGKFEAAIEDLKAAKAEARAATETRDVTLGELRDACTESRDQRADLAAAALRETLMRKALERARLFVQIESQRQSYSHSILAIRPAVETLAMIDAALADPPLAPEPR